ncbi:hypothetical protein SAMN04488100_1519 [Alkalibacterium putridalgicola]|uniref:Uncharacterized protein n=1 Tax=Alkalibacterium putridalgicola TaxID=426703 RepID=A0A1H7XI23_9LACT|nr:hypothetical protein [Alkalibacterium putridalgicola]GEK90283.1 hypothetical protein APU01nite_23220 [Alkalibacterium putridalgicola]SEM32817.1 hypothetical protein SAMN04488100_1519 [Alkalibacterium putridalgicola]
MSDIPAELKSKLLNCEEIKKNLYKKPRFSEFYEDILSNIKDDSIRYFFLENNRERIKENLTKLGFSFSQDTPSHQYYKWIENPKIINFLLIKYHNKMIPDDLKHILYLLEAEDLIAEVSDFSFFYQPNFDNIKKELFKYGFLFKSMVSYPKAENLTKEHGKTNKKVVENTSKSLLILNDSHPESYYASTRNIPEMIIKMMDNGIKYTNESPYYEIFKKNNDEIEDYFSARIRRRGNVRNDNTGAIIKYDTSKEFQELHYRLINLGEIWQKAEEYLSFFWELGQYINSFEGEISLYVSYISRIIPTAVTSAGILDSYLNNMRTENKKNNIVGTEFKPGESVSYKDGNQWRTAKVIAVEDIEKMEEKYNPYLRIEVVRPGNEVTENSIPNYLWKDKVRTGGIVTKSRGRSNIVKFNDRISKVLEKRYGDEVVNDIRIKPNLHINLIGRSVVKELRKLQQSLQFGDEKGVFMLSDLLYFDNDRESNYVNVHVISSQSVKKNNQKNSVSIFVGAKRGLDFDRFKTSKNIYFTSRIRQNYLEDGELLINQLRQTSNKNFKQQLQETENIRIYLSKKGIKIPKGVEIFVY